MSLPSDQRSHTAQLIEEDLFFPGKQVDSDSDSESEDEDAKPNASRTITEDHRSLAPGSAEEVASSVLPETPSRPTSPVPIREEAIAEETDGGDTVRYNARMRSPSSVSSQRTSTPTRPPLKVKTSHESWRHAQRPPVPKRSTSTLSLPTPKSIISPIFNPSARNANASHVPTPITPIDDLQPPDLPSSLPKPPNNPRDHTILEMIYTEMLSSRFINMSPLSLLGNLLSLHFKGERQSLLWSVSSHCQHRFAYTPCDTTHFSPTATQKIPRVRQSRRKKETWRRRKKGTCHERRRAVCV